MNEVESYEPALTFYLVAKNEMLVRIKEREFALYIWFVVLGTILTITFHVQPPNYEVLLLLPLIAGGLSMRISQHETTISKLAKYCKEEIGPILKLNKNPDLCHWDESKSLTDQRRFVGTRNFVNLILIVAPCILSLVLTYNRAYVNAEPLLKVVWISNIFFTLLAALFSIKSFIDRLGSALKIVDDNLD